MINQYDLFISIKNKVNFLRKATIFGIKGQSHIDKKIYIIKLNGKRATYC